MIVEIPKGKRNKFELDKETGLIRLDRYLYSSSVYPGDYGFIPQTFAEDNDPLDILVMVNEPTFSGCLIEARVVGMFRMKDKGANDFKVLGVPDKDPLFAHILKLEHVPPHFLREVEHFFSTYKQLEGIHTESLGGSPQKRRPQKYEPRWTASGHRWEMCGKHPGSELRSQPWADFLHPVGVSKTKMTLQILVAP